MAKNLEFKISAGVERAEQEVKRLQATGQQVASVLERDFERLGARSTVAIEAQRNAYIASYERIRNSGVATWREIQTAHAAMTAKVSALDREASLFQSGVKGARTLTEHVDNLGGSVDRLTGRFTALAGGVAVFYVGGKLWEGFKAGIKSVDDFDQAVVKTSALITTLQKGGDIASNYREAKLYAQGLNDELMKIDSRTVLNLTNLQDITEEMVKQGVVLDYTNKEQIEGFTNIANAVAVYSANGAKEAQLRQEIAALMRGEVNQNSQLASMLQRTVDGPLQRYVEQWKQSGTFVQEVGARLKGFGPAADDLAKSWGAVKSSFETSMTLMLRAGFTDIVKDIAGWLGKINEYLKSHREELGGKIREGWETAKSLMSGAATVAKAIYDNFEPFAALLIGGALIGGVTRLVTLFGTLRDIVISTRAAMIGLGMVGAGTGAAAGAAGAAGVGGVVAGAAGGGALGAGLAFGGAGLLGLGAGFAAQPLVRWADRKLYQNFGINLTGEAMFNEQEGRNRAADQRWEFFQAENANSPRNRAAGSIPIPKLDLGDTPEQVKEKMELQEKELAAFRADQEAMSAVTKDQSGIRLSILKANYNLGMVSTREYFETEKQAALDAAQKKYDRAAEYLKKEEALLNFIASKKGTDSPEYQSELAKHKKAVSEMQSAQLEYAKSYLDGEHAMTEGLRKRDDGYEKLRSSTLEAAGEYVEAERQKQEMDDRSIDMLRLRKEAEEGVEGAVEALAGVEKKRAFALAEAQIKEREHAQQYTSDIANMRDELDALNGKDQEIIKTERSMREGREKMLQLQGQLNLAGAAGDRSALEALKKKIELQGQLNERLAKEVSLQTRKGVLTGAIVGFDSSLISENNPEGAIYADSYFNELQKNGYVPDRQLTGGGTTVTYSGKTPFVNLNDPFPYLGSHAAGTRYIAKTGPYLLHQGETVRNPRETQQDLGGNVIFQVQPGALQVILQSSGNAEADADAVARAIWPKVEEFARRKRASGGK